VKRKDAWLKLIFVKSKIEAQANIFVRAFISSIVGFVIVIGFNCLAMAQQTEAARTPPPASLTPSASGTVPTTLPGAPMSNSTAIISAKPDPTAIATAVLDLEWEQVEEAAGYEVKLVPQGGGSALVFTARENRMSERVPVGIYQLRVRSKDKLSGYFGKWSPATEIAVESKIVELIEPRDNEVIKATSASRVQVTFSWSAVSNASSYMLRIWSDNEEKVQEFVTNTNSKQLKLVPSHRYRWKVTFLNRDNVGYLASPTTRSFTLLGSQLLIPIIDRNLIPSNVTRLNWSQSPGAQRYEVRLLWRFLDETQFQVQKVSNTLDVNFLEFDRLTPGAYRIEVIAHAVNRVSSEIGFYEFVVKPTETELSSAMARSRRSGS
jgi:hypothetical protein